MYAHNMQNSMNDCGIAVALSLLDQLKINRKNFSQVYNQAKMKTEQGLSIQNMMDIFIHYGIETDAYIVDDITELKKQQFPIIAVIEQDGMPHYVVIHHFEDDTIIISNPSEDQIQQLPLDAFICNFSNKVICIEKIEKKTTDNTFARNLYQEVIKKVSVTTRIKIISFTILKMMFPIFTVLGLDYIIMNKTAELSFNKVYAIILAYVPIMIFFKLVNSKVAFYKVKLTNEVQKKVLKQYYLSESSDISLNKNTPQKTAYFWNLMTAIAGIIQKYYLAIDLLYGGILLIILSIISPYCVAIILFWLIILYIISIKKSVEIKNLYNTTLINANRLSATFEENISSAGDIHSFGKENEANHFFYKKMNKFFSSNIVLTEKETNMSTILEVFNLAILLTYFLLFFYFFKTGNIVYLQNLGNGLLLLYLVSSSFKPIYSDWIGYKKSENAINFIENEQEIETEKTKLEKIITTPIINKIELENLSFSYNEMTIFEDIHFTFEKGKLYGVHGANGSGKSTLLNFILGNIKPDNMKIKINGKSFSTLYQTNIIDYIAYYSTDMHLYQNTVKNNIDFSVFGEKITDTHTINPLSLNLADDYVIVDGGNNISVGQKQKILLMRTLLREKEIYLFDEPTGNLDKEAIREFKKQVTGLRDKIVIIVTHQNDLLDYCDVTYEISTGVVTNE